MEQLDFMGIIRKYIPNILHFVDVKQFEELIREKINVRNEKREKLDRGYNPFNDGDFYDLLFFTTRIGDGVTDEHLVSAMVNLLGCYESLFLSLKNRLLEGQRTLLTDTVSKIFRNANNQYRHYIGELLVLDTALNSDFEFNEAAAKIGSIKDAEFLIANRNDGKTYLLEVVNITLTDTNPREVRRKLVRKRNDKLREGVEGDRFILQPVIWSEVISNIKEFAKKISEWDGYHFDKRVIEPFSLFMLPTESGIPRWEFAKISKTLTGFEKA